MPYVQLLRSRAHAPPMRRELSAVRRDSAGGWPSRALAAGRRWWARHNFVVSVVLSFAIWSAVTWAVLVLLRH